MKTYYYKTKAGHEIIGVYKYGYEYDLIQQPSYYAIIFHRKNMQDYNIALNYNFYDGTWAQGIYDFRTENRAREYLKEKYTILEELK